MSIEFPYLNFTTFFLGNSARPVARVRMESANDYVVVELIVDSGADITLVDSRVAEMLQLEPPTPDELYSLEGVGTGTAVYYRNFNDNRRIYFSLSHWNFALQQLHSHFRTSGCF